MSESMRSELEGLCHKARRQIMFTNDPPYQGLVLEVEAVLARHSAPPRHPDREPDDAHPETEAPSYDPATWSNMRLGVYLQTIPDVPLVVAREVLLRLGAVRERLPDKETR